MILLLFTGSGTIAVDITQLLPMLEQHVIIAVTPLEWIVSAGGGWSVSDSGEWPGDSASAWVASQGTGWGVSEGTDWEGR